MKILLILAALFSALAASNPNFELGIDSLGEQSEQTQSQNSFLSARRPRDGLSKRRL
nr:hypothetical protein [uncultured Campylobacter sp.]